MEQILTELPDDIHMYRMRLLINGGWDYKSQLFGGGFVNVYHKLLVEIDRYLVGVQVRDEHNPDSCRGIGWHCCIRVFDHLNEWDDQRFHGDYMGLVIGVLNDCKNSVEWNLSGYQNVKWNFKIIDGAMETAEYFREELQSIKLNEERLQCCLEKLDIIDMYYCSLLEFYYDHVQPNDKKVHKLSIDFCYNMQNHYMKYQYLF